MKVPRIALAVHDSDSDSEQDLSATSPQAKERIDRLNEYMLYEILGKGSVGYARRGVKVSGEEGENREYCLKFMSKRNLRRTREPCGSVLAKADPGTLDEDRETVLYMTGLERVEREIMIMELLQEEQDDKSAKGVLNLLQVIDDPEDDALVLVTVFMALGSMLKLRGDSYECGSARGTELKPDGNLMYSADRVQVLMLEFLRALKYLHSRGVCHRDLKPENVLLGSDGRLKIADFGCAEFFDKETNPSALVCHTAGTPAFWPPECIHLSDSSAYEQRFDLGLDLDHERDEYHDHDHDQDPELPATRPGMFSCYSADCWAAGVVMFCLMHYKPPFLSDNPTEMFHLIVHEPLPIAAGTDHRAAELMKGLCCKNVAERFDVGSALASQYFRC